MTDIIVAFSCGMFLGVIIAWNANIKMQSKQPAADLERMAKELLNLGRSYIDAIRWAVMAMAFIIALVPSEPGEKCSECGACPNEYHEPGCKVGQMRFLKRAYDQWCDTKRSPQ